jgi:nitronate monooxygenase
MFDIPLLKQFGIELPIIQAPMGGGPSTPELVAAVANAGGLGSIAGAYLTPQQITEEIGRVRALTDKPINVNLFAGGYSEHDASSAEPMLAILAGIHSALKLPPPALPVIPPDPFAAQLEALLDTRVPIFSFTFGIPDAESLRRARASGAKIIGTATTVEEAQLLAQADVDAIVAQGEEAGAHRGTFSRAFEASMVPTTELTQQIAREVRIPVIASGAIMDGADIARMLRIGASAVQMGTAFIPCAESGAAAVYKRALLDAASDDTTVTRAFSGRPARGIVNGFIRQVTGREKDILSFPLQNTLTRQMRKAAAQQGNAEYLSMWAGRGVTRCRAMPAADLIATLVREIEAAEMHP